MIQIQVFESSLRMLDDAVREVAVQKTQRSLEFEITSGWLLVSNSSRIIYTSFIDIPQASGEKVVIRGNNRTAGGVCLNRSRIGVVGKDSSSCIYKQGSVNYELVYPLLNDTVNSECVAIRVVGGNNQGAGKGRHDILVTYDHLNESVEGGCGVVKKPTVKLEITA